MIRRFAVFILILTCIASGMPRDAVSLDTQELPKNYRMKVEFSDPRGGTVRLNEFFTIPLENAKIHDVAMEFPAFDTAVLRIWSGGRLVRGPEELSTLVTRDVFSYLESSLNLGGDFTAVVRFSSRSDGTLFSKCMQKGKWTLGSKALIIRDGRLGYHVAGLGEMFAEPKVDDGAEHTVALVVEGGVASLHLDGKKVTEKKNFTAPDQADHVLKVGKATADFGNTLTTGRVEDLRIWIRALAEEEIAALFKAGTTVANTPDFTHKARKSKFRPVIMPATGVTVSKSWIQPLERSDHGALVKGWDAETLKEGQQIYSSLCVVCHGTKDQPGSLPTALNFSNGTFKNGADPYSMYLTQTRGFGQMVAQPQYTTAQHYAVIHYIRETFLRPHNPGQLTEITPEYIAELPKAMVTAEAEKEDRSLPPYERMDFGPALFWTYQVEPGNIAQKGIAIRLDDGPGGVSKGRAWMIYDHDTMRVAASTSGNFVDWKGIAFDGSHDTHTSLTGERHIVNPPSPGWASPSGDWKDPRPLARDGKPFGPLPREWAHYEGMHLHEGKSVIVSRIGGTRVLEMPGWLEHDGMQIFTRTFNVDNTEKNRILRVAPDNMSVSIRGAGILRCDNGFWIAELPGGAKTQLFISRGDQSKLYDFSLTVPAPVDLTKFTTGGSPKWQGVITTTSIAGPADGPFIADTFPLPIANPWESWMRPGGFDFTPDGKAAIVATWNGDVWRVDGVMNPAPAELQWRRLATGLFQPLGVKFRQGELFVLCRDQLARLDDLNGDGEIDFIANFNNDHQVTEHFHEFAMGLQTDEAGNFYYAKSARHAKDSLIPHHGTLLRVSADGSSTEILATGFRAANGVCLIDEDTFYVTDQEGHWTPKNRINRVKKGGFYGNMYGYSTVKDTANDAMEPPMVWVTNAMDRSPAELVSVPREHWGNLGGSLLNLSYGTGRAFIVPHEQVGGVWQGAVCELPMPAFGTGIMRGRFAQDGALYTCGMFAWAGNANEPGGFHRIRRGDNPAHLPLEIKASENALTVVFSEPLDPVSVKADAAVYKSWSLTRSANYGSKHKDEKDHQVTSAALAPDQRTLTLGISNLAPTDSYELKFRLRGVDGQEFERTIHGTIHHLAPAAAR